ncbi:MAG: glycoside hydrolase family 55 protein, partial [Opitutaceae bacterium]|nr:glycoside hydrolase family 55 protein [Opitutaceae bacterium]
PPPPPPAPATLKTPPRHPAGGPAAALLPPGAVAPIRASLWDEYASAPDTHPNIPNCSYSGYHYGEDPLPDTATPSQTFAPRINVRDHGAKGNGVTDDTDAIRAAIAAVKPETGGIVWFPDGKYKISKVLFVHTNKTVLRGESRDGVELIFTQPLETAWFLHRYPAKTKAGWATYWNYGGGLIWFTPSPPSPAPKDAPKRQIYDGPALPLATPAHRGDTTIRLASPAPDGLLRTGDLISLRQTIPDDYSFAKHLCGDGAWADAYDWKNAGSASWPDPSKPKPNWIVELAAIAPDGLTLTLRQPLRFDLRADWKPVLQKYAPFIRESGIENMTLRFLRDYEWVNKLHHGSCRGWNAPYFAHAIHCWLRDVTMIDMENGPALDRAKCVTLTRFTLKASTPERMTHHHGTICRGSHDNLVSDFRIETRSDHGLNVEIFSSGNVWTRGVLEHGIFDTHRNLPFENLHTDITLERNDGYHGGTGGPILGARSVEWNIRVPSGRDYLVGWANSHPDGAIVGLQGAKPVWDGEPKSTPTGEGVSGCRIENPETVPDPRNLYEAQLRLRLGGK